MARLCSWIVRSSSSRLYIHEGVVVVLDRQLRWRRDTERRLAARVTDAAIAAKSLLEHAEQHRHLPIHVVIDLSAHEITRGVRAGGVSSLTTGLGRQRGTRVAGALVLHRFYPADSTADRVRRQDADGCPRSCAGTADS